MMMMMTSLSSSSRAFEFQTLQFATRMFDERRMRMESQDRKGRIYANASKINLYGKQVTRDELFTMPSDKNSDRETLWITTPFRLGVAVAAYSVYPVLVELLSNSLPEATRGEATALTANFAPAVSLLYGAWLSITFTILEERISSLQKTATEESALLCALCRRTAKIVEPATAKVDREALFAPIFEQTTIMANKSREEELLVIANDDVYRRYQIALQQSFPRGAPHTNDGQLDALADVVDNLASKRAVRLAQETTSLPAEHFAILAVFSTQLLACFVYVAACSPNDDGGNNSVLRVAFSVFVAFFLLVFNFALDLNDPFRGNYQIRRSAINANIIATRRLAADIVGLGVVKAWEQACLGCSSEQARLFWSPSPPPQDGDGALPPPPAAAEEEEERR